MRPQAIICVGLIAAMAGIVGGVLVQGSTALARPQTLEPRVLLGFSTFPYDLAPASVDQMFKLGRDYGSVYTVQRDNGVPWKEALEDEEFPDKVLNDWKLFLERRPAGRPLYLALAPLDFDRKNLIHAVEGSSMPDAIKDAAFDSESVKRAYLNYSRRAVQYFRPDFLNLGVEAGELAHRNPSAWPAFSRLIAHVQSNLKREFPNLKIGISFGLQSLMEPATAARAKELVEASDYLGLSFYPYMSNFHEKFGIAPLPSPPDEWRKSLDWARAYTNKPIAICETGYNSENVSFPGNEIALRGSKDWQARYVEDLVRIATRDKYLFLIWYFPVDLGRFLRTLPDNGGPIVLWEKNGLLDENLRPKPAFEVWQRALHQR